MGKTRQISSSSARSSSSSGARRDSGGNKRTPQRAGGSGSPRFLRKPPPRSSSSSGDGDKYELSPNNRAKCTKCKQPILKGTKRIGKETWNAMYRKYTYKYYHEQCASQRITSQLRFKNQDENRIRDNNPSINLNDELERQASQKQQDKAEISSRNYLKQKLRQLRTEFANRLKVKPYQIFHNTTLDSLILNLPKTIPELKKVHGIGPKKIQCFGESILQVIRQYLNLKPRKNNKNRQQQPNPQQSNNQSSLLKQRQHLINQLKELRTRLAKQKRVASYEIFTNKTIDDIVVKLPTNNQQLVQVHGIKDKKCQAYGQDILHVISTWSNSKPSSLVSPSLSSSAASAAVMVTPNKTKNSNSKRDTTATTAQQQQWKRRKVMDKNLGSVGGAVNSPVVIDDDYCEVVDRKDDDGVCHDHEGEEGTGIEIMGTLSIEDIVQQKFDHATQFGYVISVDDDDGDGDGDDWI